MPPTTSFNREKLIDAAFKIIRIRGREKLTARAIAARLHCSTMPVYSYLKSMKQVDADLYKKTIELLLQYQTTNRTGEPFYDMGLGYVLFASNEKNLFRFPAAEHSGKRQRASDTLIPKMKADPVLSGLAESQLESILIKMWVFVHGLALLANSGALPRNDQPYFEEMLHEVGFFVIEGEKNKSTRLKGGSQ
jgi:AcrR family transcriptional regulator